MLSLRKVSAFIKKEFLSEISYRFAFFFHFFSIFAQIITFYFIDRLFGSRITPHLKPYGVNYFSYVLLSIAFFTYVGTGLSSLNQRIRTEQLIGTLEALLVTPTKISTIIFSLGLWDFIWASISVVLYLFFGVILFGVDLTQINLLSTAIILILTIISFYGMGLIAASFIIVLKKGQPITWLVNSLFGLLGGVYYPVSVLPAWLGTLSQILPVTYSIKAMQLAVYKGYSAQLLTSEITALIICSIVILPAGLYVFKWAIKRTRIDGSITHY
ncbi:MAG: ABC transporter permease [Candidatus Omnitrophota bacterium]